MHTKRRYSTMIRNPRLPPVQGARCVAALLLLLGSTLALAAAPVTMKSIEFSSLPGDKTEIRMGFTGTPPMPTGYTIEVPARIALDLVGVKSGLDSKYHPLGSGNTQSVTVVEAPDRTRVIVAMQELSPYNVRVDGNTLYLMVGKQETAGFVQEATTGLMGGEGALAGGEPASEQTSIQDVDFRRGELGEGRVIVTLSNPGTGVDVSSEGGSIVVEFSNAALPKSLQRRLDVTDFATPVVAVETLADAGNVLMTVEPTGDFDYLAYQADNVFTLEVKPITASELESEKAAAFRYRGEKLSLNFQDIEIRSVLQLIADFTDFNLVASDTISGRITLRLKNVPWDQALDVILKAKGLDKRQVGNVLTIAPASELAAREKMELESRQQRSELAPLRTEFIEVRYANAAEIFQLFQSASENAGMISPRGSVIVDERTNSIILTETTDKINEFRAVLEKLDVPVRQVQIEARIVTASSNFSDQMGVRWGTTGFGSYQSNKVATQVGGSLTTLGEIRDRDTTAGAGGITATSPDNLVVDLGIGAETATSIAVGLLESNYLLELELSALESEGHAEVIARPKVITADKQQATISSGVEIPYQEASSSGATSTSFKSATLSLNVKPQITPDDRIIMDLSVNQDTVGAVFNGVPSINTNSIETQVLVNNGETIVLGGIFTTQATESVTKMPFFGDLPYVGRFFRRNTKSDDKQELLIFITPRLIRESLTAR